MSAAPGSIPRQREIEGRPMAFRRFDPYATRMTLDDLFANRKADARPRVLFAAVKPLEHFKDPVGKARIETDAVVAHRKNPVRRLRLNADVNRRRLRTAKFDCVGDQILQ